MIRYIIFLFLLSFIIYYSTVWIGKWIKSTKDAVERKEKEAWKKYDSKLNPKPKTKQKKK